MDLEEAIARIEVLETENTALKDEKTKLLSKRDDLLGQVKKLKTVKELLETNGNPDIAELLESKTKLETLETEYSGKSDKIKTEFERRLAAIEAERAQEKTDNERREKERQQAELERDILTEYTKPEYEIYSPRQLLVLTKAQISRNEAGNTVVSDGYTEQPLAEFLKELKTKPEYLNQFKGSGATGSGGQPNGKGAIHSSKNPWRDDQFNLTEQAQLVRDNPDQAKRLAKEAGKG